MPLLEVRRLRQSYPDGWTLGEISFSIERGELLCLLGPSGCGKTTLLRLIAGLETPEDGQVLLEGEDISRMPPHQRGFGLMFQEYALFPHKDVFGNVAFGLRMAGRSRDEVAARVQEVLEWVGLVGFERRDVGQLSGGERQRVALARSLAPQPRLLMLDEPLGALDRTLRERLMEDLPHILRRAGVTAITVTHDQEEAFALADRVVLMRAGTVVQVGTPDEVYRRPASAWAAQFLGLTNLLDLRAVERNTVETQIGTLHVADQDLNEEAAQLLVRPEAARFGDQFDPEGENVVSGVVTERVFHGERYRLKVRCAGSVELVFRVPADGDLPVPGESVTFSLAPHALTLLAG
jgi:ABC-type Fe3+/spermidine/putrescine transport system ATPase subunit